MFYTRMVQVVILYILEPWVMSPWIGKTLGVFHHQVIQRLMGWMTQCNRYGKRTYPTLEEEMVEAVIHEVDTYVSRCQYTIA